MDTNTVVTLMGQAIVMVAKLAGPILVATLVVGLSVSLFQAVTTVQEFTLTFLPKLVVVAAILALTGHWMVTQLVDYVQQLYGTIPQLLS
ncbi:MAG: flagellar biosynthesis protein FliQ [Acidimicrobiales bacterium]|jgi:flagellar biosynthetic protein FliQ